MTEFYKHKKTFPLKNGNVSLKYFWTLKNGCQNLLFLIGTTTVFPSTFITLAFLLDAFLGLGTAKEATEQSKTRLSESMIIFFLGILVTVCIIKCF